MITKTNGSYHGVALRGLDAEPDWREECLAESFRGHHYGECTPALLRSVRRFRADDCTILVETDRGRAVQFLRESLTDLQTCVAPTECVQPSSGEAFMTYTGWWRGTFGGASVEVVLPPSWYYHEDLLIFGSDPAQTKAFAAALIEFAEHPQNRTLLYSGKWQDATQIDAEIGRTTWGDLVMPPETITQIRGAVEGWANGKAMYEAMGFAWRRGILLVGPPGTGKTMIAKAIAAQLTELPFLYVRDFGNDHAEAIQKIFRRARHRAPCLLVLEDIDTLITPENRSILLNEMDGFKSNHGVLIVASTNHPEKIDEAFLKRPSRFDRVFHIGLPEPAERAEYCRRVLARAGFASRLAPGLDTEGLIAKIVERSKGFTPAYLKEALTGAALDLAHRGHAGDLNHVYADAVMAQVDELRRTMRRLNNPAALSDLLTGGDAIGLRRGGDD